MATVEESRDTDLEEASATAAEDNAPESVDDADPIGEHESDEDADDAVVDRREDNVRRLLPVHNAPRTGKNDLKVTRQRGRPRKVERMPTTSDLQYHAQMSEEKSRFVEDDPIYKAALANLDSAKILHQVKIEVAKEAAALQFQRLENEKLGRDTAQISTRRIDALTKIANIELEIKKLGGDLLDLRSEKFQSVFKLWIGDISTIASQVLDAATVDILFNKLTTQLEGWEDRAAVQLAKR